MNTDACASKRGSAFFWYSSFQQKSSKDYIVSANLGYYVDLGDEKQLNIFKCLEIVWRRNCQICPGKSGAEEKRAKVQAENQFRLQQRSKR